MESVKNTLQTRAKTHGDFAETAATAQALKHVMRSAPRWNDLTAIQAEALDCMATKIARALCGDPHEIDHWHDQAGYAGLAEREIAEAQAKSNVTPIAARQDAIAPERTP